LNVLLMKANQVHAHRRIGASIAGFIATVALAQDATQPGGPATFAGDSTRFSDDQKLLKPLPPPLRDAPPPSPDPRNFEGTWAAERRLDPPPGAGPMAPYTPAAGKDYRHRLEMIAVGAPVGGTSAWCRPMQAIGADLFPAEIVQTPQQLVILNEDERAG
jgi:hypothetical protein